MGQVQSDRLTRRSGLIKNAKSAARSVFSSATRRFLERCLLRGSSAIIISKRRRASSTRKGWKGRKFTQPPWVRAPKFLFICEDARAAAAAGVWLKLWKQCAETSLSRILAHLEQNAPVSIFVCVRSLSSQSGGRAARESAFSSLRQHKINTGPACGPWGSYLCALQGANANAAPS